jgi:rubrerythrin
MTKSARVITVTLLLMTVATAAYATGNSTTSNRTTENLQAAFNGERNAHARYLGFAAKADREGHGEVASLFRAAARAEDIHAGSYAVLIKKMGASTEPKLNSPVVKSTTENLEFSIKVEGHERDQTYPRFIGDARAEGNLGAVKCFNSAAMTANEHHRLFAEAFRNLHKLSGTNCKTFYVCPECGLTSSSLDFEKCPCCLNPRETFEEVG